MLQVDWPDLTCGTPGPAAGSSGTPYQWVLAQYGMTFALFGYTPA